jgi:O-glycosyl hydrolase
MYPMMRNRYWLCAALFTIVFATAGGLYARDPEVTVDTATKFQTITGWGGTNNIVDHAPEWLRLQIFDELVNQLGLTGMRMENPIMTGFIWENPNNDDGDPNHFNWDRFDRDGLTRHVKKDILPLKQRVEARGDTFILHQSGWWGPKPQTYLYDPEEYAEWAASFCLHMKAAGCAPTYWAVANEPDNRHQIDPNTGVSTYSPAIIAERIRLLGPRLAALGVETKIQYPECMKPDGAIEWVSGLAALNDPDVWKYIGLLSFHEYGTSSAGRKALFAFAQSKGLNTAHTETGSEFEFFYRGLVEAGTSYWERYGFNMYTKLSPTLGGFTHWGFWDYRQIMHYVRPGAVRVKAATTLSAIRPLAFVKDGKVTVVLVNTTGGGALKVVLKALPAGQYGASVTTGTSIPPRQLGIQTVAAGGTMSVDLPANGILTVYPYAGANLAPDFTDVLAAPDTIARPTPTTSVALSAAATDAELDTITYTWVQKSGPAVQIAAPNQAATTAQGFTTPGLYVFTVTATDGKARSSRDLYVTVAAPPVITGPLEVTTTVVTGNNFVYEVRATNTPTTFEAANLPKGLRSGAIIFGSLPVPGTYRIPITVSNLAGSDTKTLVLTVKPEPADLPAITSALAARATAGRPFNYTLAAANNPLRLGAPSLPKGLRYDPAARMISGTPEADGTFAIPLWATNALGTCTETLTLTVGK